MSNKLVLYNVDLSPTVRFVKIVAKLIDVDLELKNIDLVSEEQLKEPFIKINPEHTVPTLVDGDFVIWDSHVICAYLVDKYAKDDKLYPKDLQLRAKCNQRMFFDAACLFVRIRDAVRPVFYHGAKKVSEDMIESFNSSFGILEAFLATDPFLVGQNLTIADISVAITVLMIDIFAPLNSEKHPKILAWLKRVRQTVPVFDEINAEKLQEFKQIFLSKLAE